MIQNGKGKHSSPKTKDSKRKRAKVVTPKLNNIYKPSGMSLTEWQVSLRQQQATKETFAIKMVDEKYGCGEFSVRNAMTGNDYKVVYRGKDSIWNYCSCFDFKTSQLGTCKHIEAVKLWVKKKRKKVQCLEPDYSSVYIDYKGPRTVKLRIGNNGREEFKRLANNFFDETGKILPDAYAKFEVFIQAAKTIDSEFRCYGDALDFIIDERDKEKRSLLIGRKYPDKTLDDLLTVRLYPYQKEGIRFAVKAGKAIIADEMGLGKTIQAIASAEIFLSPTFTFYSRFSC